MKKFIVSLIMILALGITANAKVAFEGWFYGCPFCYSSHYDEQLQLCWYKPGTSLDVILKGGKIVKSIKHNTQIDSDIVDACKCVEDRKNWIVGVFRIEGNTKIISLFAPGSLIPDTYYFN